MPMCFLFICYYIFALRFEKRRGERNSVMLKGKDGELQNATSTIREMKKGKGNRRQMRK